MSDRNLPRLYAIADLDFAGGTDGFKRYISSLAEAARRHRSELAIQVRAKQAPPTTLAKMARFTRETIGRDALLVLNGPEQLAAELGYDGVHWPENLVPEQPSTAHPLQFRSAAAHSTTAVTRAAQANATAIVYSPVFAPTWKSSEPAGLTALEEAAAATTLPVYALGGINPARVRACLQAGAYGIAALSGIASANDPLAACRQYLDALR